MAEGRSVRWLFGCRVTRAKGSLLSTWLAGGKLWRFDNDMCRLHLVRGDKSEYVCNCECIKLAVGFTVGVEEAMGASDRTRLLKVIGG